MYVSSFVHSVNNNWWHPSIIWKSKHFNIANILSCQKIDPNEKHWWPHFRCHRWHQSQQFQIQIQMKAVSTRFQQNQNSVLKPPTKQGEYWPMVSWLVHYYLFSVRQNEYYSWNLPFRIIILVKRCENGKTLIAYWFPRILFLLHLNSIKKKKCSNSGGAVLFPLNHLPYLPPSVYDFLEPIPYLISPPCPFQNSLAAFKAF